MYHVCNERQRLVCCLLGQVEVCSDSTVLSRVERDLNTETHDYMRRNIYISNSEFSKLYGRGTIISYILVSPAHSVAGWKGFLIVLNT